MGNKQGAGRGMDLGYVTLTQLSESQGTGQIFTLLEQFPQCWYGEFSVTSIWLGFGLFTTFAQCYNFIYIFKYTIGFRFRNNQLQFLNLTQYFFRYFTSTGAYTSFPYYFYLLRLHLWYWLYVTRFFSLNAQEQFPLLENIYIYLGTVQLSGPGSARISETITIRRENISKIQDKQEVIRAEISTRLKTASIYVLGNTYKYS